MRVVAIDLWRTDIQRNRYRGDEKQHGLAVAPRRVSWRLAAMVLDQARPLTRADRALYCKLAGDRCRLFSLSDGIRNSQRPSAPFAAV
jgi:hypothetical protein